MTNEKGKLVCFTEKELEAIIKKAYEEGYRDADAGHVSRYEQGG